MPVAIGSPETGLDVASADVNHDGIPDIIVSKETGPGRVKIFDGQTDALIANFLPFATRR